MFRGVRQQSGMLHPSDRFFLLLLVVCIGSLVVKWDEYSSCDDPLHLWILLDYILLFIFRLTHLAFVYRARNAELYDETCLSASRMYIPIKFILFPAMFSWNIVGCIWLARSGECLPRSSQKTSLVVVLTFTFVYLLGYAYLLYRGERAWRALGGGMDNSENILRQLHTLGMLNNYGVGVGNGLTRRQIEGFPVRPVTQSELSSAPGGSTCSICISDLTVGEDVRGLRCRHLFHSECIEEWMRFKSLCPNCNQAMEGVEDNGDVEAGVEEEGAERRKNGFAAVPAVV